MTIDPSKIKMLISDVDGVWTDGTFYKGTDNLEFKRFSILDGVGVAMARAAELIIALISGRYSPATEHRARELNIEDIYNGGLNKLLAYTDLKTKYGLSDNEVADIGDDLIDIPVMEQVGFPIAVQNAHPRVKAIAAFITEASGGQGAFREAVEWVINQQGRTKEVYQILREQVLTG